MFGTVIKHFLRSWKQHMTMQVTTLTVLVGTFTVVSLSLLLHQNLDKTLTQWGDSVKMSVYLKDDINEEQRSYIEKYLVDSPTLHSLEYVSKDQAAKNFQKQITSVSANILLDPEFGNPLPASFEVGINEYKFSSLTGLAKEILEISGVDDVSYGQGWVKNYASVVNIFSVTSSFLIFILLLGSLFVVSNSIRNSVSQRREEIEILELVGGTSFQIRAPYIFEGVVLGILAAIISLILGYVIYKWQISIVQKGLNIWNVSSNIEYLSLTRMFLILSLGMIFGALGSYVCVRKISNGWAAAQSSR